MRDFSLPQVIGLNMETQDGFFEEDHEGQTLVNSINERLPPKASLSYVSYMVNIAQGRVLFQTKPFL